ncbi:kinesin-like protein KIN-5B [Euphorbia lathyris]|uniref:kinesin-like protein KIN-5B n=1 Tax=Euphorbia lathyris TaxID=212925 RepID=UPI00331344F9
MFSLTPDQFKKVGLGVTPSPSPFLTPRPERRRPDSRGSDWSYNRQDRDKEVNVQVLLRCRPLSDEEQKINVPRVISCNEHKREVTVLQSIANKQVDRLFTFDKVFGPKSQQRSIYDQAIAPIVNEVLDGFNCTVFAYGQTGTGKTYTMEGGMRNKGGDLPAEAGVIPRAVRHIFDTLEAQNADYSMKVTFLELYNEEITDLLAPEESMRSTEDRQKKPISLMEDGKGCVVVRGLEEEAVYSANEIYTLLERGAAKRRTADTLLNKRSSRSHSVFSITIYVKEATVGEEDIIKCGKLNLVDLAGSENISRSGAKEGRAREAGEINKSLLTLGRVINALAEHSAHIPYRDSKLTRLLRDSLGGKTKTCIIATISPSAHSLEETLSTLDYAHRAKNIKNKPEANQKMSKAVLLKDLYLEIERMKADVRAAREKNGVYVPHDRFVKDEADKKTRIEKIEQLENDLNLRDKEVVQFRNLYITEQEEKLDIESELKDCKLNLQKSNKELLNLQEKHKIAISMLKEKESIISKLLCSESSLIERAKEMRCDLQTASEDITSLFGKLDQKDKMEAQNQRQILIFGSHLDQSLKDLHRTILGSVSQQQQQIRCLEEHAQSFLASKCDATEILESRIKKISETCTSGVAAFKEVANTMQHKASSDLENIYATTSSQTMNIEHFLDAAVLEAKEVIEQLQNMLNEQKQLLALSAQKQEEGLKRSLTSSKVITKATTDFLNDINHQASKITTAFQKSQMKTTNQLTEFEKKFKEESAREEKQALQNIAEILAALTSRKTAMVSEASKSIQDLSREENKRFEQEMSSIQQVSAEAKADIIKYAQNVETDLVGDTFSVALSRDAAEDILQECSKWADCSWQQWENAKSNISNLNKSSILELDSTVKENVSKNCIVHEEFLSRCSAVSADFDNRTCAMKAAISDSLIRDQESTKELESIATHCSDQLQSIQEIHGENISNIRNTAEKCLTQDYLVDENTGTTPKRRAIAVPSLASIEEMRTSANENVKEDKGSKRAYDVSKISASPNRDPFSYIN